MDMGIEIDFFFFSSLFFILFFFFVEGILVCVSLYAGVLLLQEENSRV